MPINKPIEGPLASPVGSPLSLAYLDGDSITYLLEMGLTNSIGEFSFSRASIAVVKDHEDRLVTCKANEARFQGARRVENLLGPEEWTTLQATFEGYVAGPEAGQLARRYKSTSTSPNLYKTLSTLIGSEVVNSIWLRVEDESGSDNLFTISSGTIVSTAGTSITIDSTWKRYSTGINTVSAATQIVGISKPFNVNNVDYTFDVYCPQLEEVTLLSNTNYPSESVTLGYVETGISPDPEFDGDGSEWTYKDTEWTVSGGNATYVGSTSKKLQQDDAVVDYGLYYYEATASGFTGDVAVEVLVGSSTASLTISSNGTYSGYLSSNNENNNLVIRASATGSQTAVLSHFRISKISHGSGVDGVKYFTTENGNSVSGGLVTEAAGAPLTTDMGLLIECDATSEFNDSYDISNASYWVPVRCSVIDDGDILLPGYRAYLMRTNTTVTAQSVPIYQTKSANLSNGDIVVANSVLKPAGTTTWCRLGINSGAGTYGAYFNLEGNGSVGIMETGVVDASIVPLADGAYWCSMTKVVPENPSTKHNIVVQPSLNNGNSDLTLGSGEDVLIVGSLSSYRVHDGYPSPVYTDAAPTTRPGEANAVYIPQSEKIDHASGSLVFTWVPNKDAIYYQNGVDIGLIGTSSSVTSFVYATASASFPYIKATDGTNTAVSPVISWTRNTPVKIAIRWSTTANELQVIVNGVAGTATSYDGSLTASTNLYLGMQELSGDLRNIGLLTSLSITSSDQGENWCITETT